MFNLEVTTSNQFRKNAVDQHLERLLKEIISKETPFEDKADFLLWAEESLPLIHWEKSPSQEGGISFYLLLWASSDHHPELFFTSLKRKLSAIGEIPRMSFEHYNFGLQTIPHKKISLTEVQLYPENPSECLRIFNLLPGLVEELLIEVKSPQYGQYFAHQAKPVSILDKIAQFKRRFYSQIDDQIFDEAKGFLAIAEPKFIEQRSSHLLSRLILSQYFMRKALLKADANAHDSRYVSCRVLPSHLSSPFSSKKVLGIFIAINLFHKYDIFTEEHVLRALQRLDLDVISIPGGSYSLQRHGESFKFVYVEIEKRDKKPFTFKEYKKLRCSLKEVLKISVERLQPSVFMVNNEEDIIKNILLLNREIRSSTDLAQVMIHFEEQNDKEVCFRIIFVYPGEGNLQLSLKTALQSTEAAYKPDWTQIVRHLRKKHPVQAHVFRLRIGKSAALLRSDGSLNFYAARQKISELLVQAIGEFRDFNGGMILKQGEALAHFKQLFSDYPSEILENFFYGINPIEIQAVIPLSNLSLLFELFIEGKGKSFTLPNDCFVKFVQKGIQTYLMVQAKEISFADCIKASLNCIKLDPKNLISVQIAAEEQLSLGYIFEHENQSKHSEFIDAVQRGVDAWKKKLFNIKTLRLAISSGLRPLDPRIQGDEDTKLILKMLFEGLTRINARGKVELGVAKKVRISSDRKKYTFDLRPTYWSNGMLVSADDFVYAWRTLLSPTFKAPSAYLFYPIKNAQEVKEGRLPSEFLEVKALNNDTLEINLEYQIPYFLELLAQPQFSPINSAVDRSQPTWPHQEDASYICNGAFLLKKNHPSQGYELIKNPSYHAASLIALDKAFIKNAQQAEIKEMFLRDEIDWLGFPAGSVDISTLPIGQGETVVLPNDSMYWYVFNTRCFPFNNSKVRKALAYVINRARILQNIPPGHWPAFSILPFQHSHGTLMEESLQKGKDLFQEALNEMGLDRASFPVLRLLHVGGKIRTSVAKIVQQEWEEAFGIRCQIEAYSWKEIFNRLTEGNFQICGINWISMIDDPSYTLQIFQNASKFINFPRWSHQEYEKLLELSNREKKLSKRLYYNAVAEEILLQEAPVIPLVRSLPCSMKKSRVEMFSHSSLKSWDFKWASIRNIQSKE
jgi:ABC-type oligopeptide transport system substrate-binding subunit